MILEIAEIQIQAGQQSDFESAIAHAITSVISQAQGFISARVQHGLESPERYILQIEWATLEDHTLHFRNGPLFPAWRAIVGPFFAQPPRVEHYHGVI